MGCGACNKRKSKVAGGNIKVQKEVKKIQKPSPQKSTPLETLKRRRRR